jgi:hypothetical protein
MGLSVGPFLIEVEKPQTSLPANTHVPFGSIAEMALVNPVARTTPKTGNPVHDAGIGSQIETVLARQGSTSPLSPTK